MRCILSLFQKYIFKYDGLINFAMLKFIANLNSLIKLLIIPQGNLLLCVNPYLI